MQTPVLSHIQQSKKSPRQVQEKDACFFLCFQVSVVYFLLFLLFTPYQISFGWPELSCGQVFSSISSICAIVVDTSCNYMVT